MPAVQQTPQVNREKLGVMLDADIKHRLATFALSQNRDMQDIVTELIREHIPDMEIVPRPAKGRRSHVQG